MKIGEAEGRQRADFPALSTQESRNTPANQVRSGALGAETRRVGEPISCSYSACRHSCRPGDNGSGVRRFRRHRAVAAGLQPSPFLLRGLRHELGLYQSRFLVAWLVGSQLHLDRPGKGKRAAPCAREEGGGGVERIAARLAEAQSSLDAHACRGEDAAGGIARPHRRPKKGGMTPVRAKSLWGIAFQPGDDSLATKFHASTKRGER